MRSVGARRNTHTRPLTPAARRAEPVSQIYLLSTSHPGGDRVGFISLMRQSSLKFGSFIFSQYHSVRMFPPTFSQSDPLRPSHCGFKVPHHYMGQNVPDDGCNTADLHRNTSIPTRGGNLVSWTKQGY